MECPMSDRVNARLLAAHLKPKAQRLLKHVEDLAGGEALLPDQSAEVVVASEDYELRLTVCRRHRGLFTPPADEAPVAVPHHNGKSAAVPSGNGLKRIHRKIVEKATDTPVPAKALLKAAGYEANTYGRDAITYLTRAGILQRTPDGIRLPPVA